MSERDTIPATCPRCGRPVWRTEDIMTIALDPIGMCNAAFTVFCDVAAAGYRRGIDEGVRLAKDHATVTKYGSLSFHGLDAAAAKAKGEA